MLSKEERQERLQVEVDFVNENAQALLKKYRGKVVIVKDKKVVSVHDDFNLAAGKAAELYGPDDVYVVREITEHKPHFRYMLIDGER
ncbi:MAG: hypothetical protein GDA50_00055 [Alphaproteobacteria bacterium GM202ARS2]|nr:hypothetical protein [Alphaproteobacteria bacterium GM202ARS2]